MKGSTLCPGADVGIVEKKKGGGGLVAYDVE